VTAGTRLTSVTVQANDTSANRLGDPSSVTRTVAPNGDPAAAV